jgi:tetratricopeptide (TPR) repeat protein
MTHGVADDAAVTSAESDVRSPLPDAASYAVAARGLREAHDLDGAEALLSEGTVNHPDHIGLLVDYASLADHRRDWPTALQRWERLRHESPDDLRGHLGAARALREMQRLTDAEALLAETVDRFPKHPHPLLHYAALAQERGDHSEALLRWARARKDFPNEMIGYVHAAVALRDMGNLDEADSLLSEAVERFLDRPEPLGHYAYLGECRQDWPEALRRWHLNRDRFPDRPQGYVRASALLRRLELLDDAEAVIAEGLRRLPSERSVLFEAADLAVQRNDWPLAVTRWQEAQRHFPDDAGIAARIDAAKERIEEERFAAVVMPVSDSVQNGGVLSSDDERAEPAVHGSDVEQTRAIDAAVDSSSFETSPQRVTLAEQSPGRQIKPEGAALGIKTWLSRLRGASLGAKGR